MLISSHEARRGRNPIYSNQCVSHSNNIESSSFHSYLILYRPSRAIVESLLNDSQNLLAQPLFLWLEVHESSNITWLYTDVLFPKAMAYQRLCSDSNQLMSTHHPFGSMSPSLRPSSCGFHRTRSLKFLVLTSSPPLGQVTWYFPGAFS